MSGPASIDATHDAALASWVESANAPDCDFPIQNLPFGRFRTNANEDWRIGVAIGDQVLDLRASGLIDHADMHRLMALPPAARRELRAALSQGLRRGSAQESAWRSALRAMDSIELGLPCPIRNYTDFYVGIHHATAVGKLFRPDNPLLPNYKWVPIGYHGRASSIIASGQPVRRPRGQVAGDPAPRLAATQRLDHELELGSISSLVGLTCLNLSRCYGVGDVAAGRTDRWRRHDPHSSQGIQVKVSVSVRAEFDR